MKFAYKALVMLACLCSLQGCSTVGNNADMAIFNHYQSIDNYGALFLHAGEEISGSTRTNSFIEHIKAYAKSRGIELSGESNYQPTDSKITFNLDEKSQYTFTLERNGKIKDQLTYPSLDEQTAHQVIDEMLLLWYPPNFAQSKRKPVPENVLLPTSYEITQASIFNTGESLNMGWQNWYELDTLQPEFTWETFPREWDIPPGMTADDFKNVRYEFRILEGEEKSNLTEPHYQISEPLSFCQRAYWTVRAVFELNGSTRLTEWSGAYTIFFSQNSKPWIHRRNVKSLTAALYTPESTYYFAIIAPHSPFVESCEG